MLLASASMRSAMRVLREESSIVSNKFVKGEEVIRVVTSGRSPKKRKKSGERYSEELDYPQTHLQGF